jgi:hypothetical protein
MKIPDLEWPDDTTEVQCIGFSQPLIYDLIHAIDHGRVKVISKDTNAWYSSYTFDYFGFRYELAVEEVRNGVLTPYRLQKLARIDEDDAGETVIVESFTNPQLIHHPNQPTYDDSWGSF